MYLAGKFAGAFSSYFRRFIVIGAFYLAAQTFLRLGLALKTGSDLADTWWDYVQPFAIGLWFDVLVLSLMVIPATVYWVLLPRHLRGGRVDRALTFGCFAFVAFLTGFVLIGEVLFWDEFSARFNFIAVDYLVYTREVVGNIWQSYPVAKLINGLVAGSLLLAYLLRRQIAPVPDRTTLAARAAVGTCVAATASAMFFVTASNWTNASSNQYANELSGNGYYAFVYAFLNNEIDYKRFYRTTNPGEINTRIRSLVEAPNAKFVRPGGWDITRDISYKQPMLKKNVVLVTIESLSARYMGTFGHDSGLTPNLDEVASQSLLFTNMLATGTRTVRGLEAVTLAVPPTPGQSILRRPHNENLFSIGSVLRDHGYSTTYLYGGDGRFDSMNEFFSANGYRVIDRGSFPPTEVTFFNAWGVCDEDLFARAVKEADASFAKGELFFQHVMTVSNHRPFTYPAGKIELPSIVANRPLVNMSDRTIGKYAEQTREAAIKYTDYAIGQFLRNARSKPWFSDTLFVFVADHTASAAGKIEIDVDGYHIPAMIYAPSFVQSRRDERLVSQMDVAPTILGALKIGYRSRFVGVDQFYGDGPERALISNYAKIALVRQGKTVLLEPKRLVRGYSGSEPLKESQLDNELLQDAIAFYQYSSDWRERFSAISSTTRSP